MTKEYKEADLVALEKIIKCNRGEPTKMQAWRIPTILTVILKRWVSNVNKFVVSALAEKLIRKIRGLDK